MINLIFQDGQIYDVTHLGKGALGLSSKFEEVKQLLGEVFPCSFGLKEIRGRRSTPGVERYGKLFELKDPLSGRHVVGGISTKNIRFRKAFDSVVELVFPEETADFFISLRATKSRSEWNVLHEKVCVDVARFVWNVFSPTWKTPFEFDEIGASKFIRSIVCLFFIFFSSCYIVIFFFSVEASKPRR